MWSLRDKIVFDFDVVLGIFVHVEIFLNLLDTHRSTFSGIFPTTQLSI